MLVLRLSLRSCLSFGLVLSCIIGAIGVAPPSRVAASPPAPVAPAIPPRSARHTVLPPRGFVPAPLRRADRMVLVRAHGLRFRMPARATLSPALRAALFGPDAHGSGAAARRHHPPAMRLHKLQLGLPPVAAPARAPHSRLRGVLAPRVALASAVAAAASPSSLPPLISIDAVQGRFFTNPNDNGAFDIGPSTPPLFTQQFTTIDFNPPSSAQVSCTNSTGVDEFSRPMADVVPQPDGSCATQVIAGNGYQAGVNFPGPDAGAFEAVFTARLTVARPGPVTLNLFSDDGWILAAGPDSAGDQPTYVQGPYTNAPAAGPTTGYRVVGSYNQPSSPAQNSVVVNFPAAGTYPIELDYTECCGGQLALTLGSNYGNPIMPATISRLPGDQSRNTDQCPCAQPSTSHPVNTRTGNYWADDTDLVVSSPGPSLGWVRTYNSQATGDADQPGILGYGWSVPYMTHVITAGAAGGEPGVAIVASATDNRWRFRDLGNGQFQAFPGVYATLTQAGDVYTETLRTGERISFDATGRATATTDAQGRQVLLQYNGSQLARIVDGANPGRYLTLDYDPSGAHIVAVHDPTGRTMRYSYDGNGDLVGSMATMGSDEKRS